METQLAEFEKFLDTIRIPLRLACTTESGWPVVVSLWFQHKEGCLYCATQKSARIVSYLQNNPRCAFEIAEDLPPYCGIRGQSLASIDDKIGSDILGQLLVRYLGSTDSGLAQNLLAKRKDEVAIVLKPINIFTWDFSDRMQDIISPGRVLTQKFCP